MTAAHGTFSRYCNDRCRCIPCTDANTAYHRAYRKAKRAQAPTCALCGAKTRTAPAVQDRDGSRPAASGQEKDSQ